MDKKEYLEDKLKNCKLGKKFSGNLRSESLFNEEIETIEGIMEDLKNYEKLKKACLEFFKDYQFTSVVNKGENRKPIDIIREIMVK